MTINGHTISTWQKCKRRYRLEQQYRYLKWHPNTLLSSVMRQAILSLSTGVDSALVGRHATSTFMNQSKQPGLLRTEGIDVYKLAMDYVAMLKTLIEYLSRIGLVELSVKPVAALDANVAWSYLSQVDESGTLHRWRFVDFVNEDTITTELHSWELFGDLAISGQPMTLHMVAVGRREKDRHTSPWCKAYKSPAMNMYKFQKKAGGGLSDNWLPVWFADDIDMDAGAWVDQMQADNIADNLVQHIMLDPPEPVHVAAFNSDLKYELQNIAAYSKLPWFRTPMSRGSCDKPYICPHQELCFSLNPEVELTNSPLYEKLK